MVLVPFHGVMKPSSEILELWLPSGFFNKLAIVNGVSLVVPRTIVDVVKIVWIQPKFRQDHLGYLKIVLFAISADEVRIANPALIDDLPHSGVVI
jgi:hypothetical protein